MFIIYPGFMSNNLKLIVEVLYDEFSQVILKLLSFFQYLSW